MSALLGHTGAWHSLSGVRLEGARLTRAIYMDESGSSAREPFLAVAAVIIEPDKHLGPVEDEIRGIIDRYIPAPLRVGYVLHAVDLFNGNKKALPLEIWEESVRRQILEEVVSIPKKLGLELCVAHVDKARFLKHTR